MSSCQVRGCRFIHSHVTMSHKCGKCGIYGHGQIECGIQHKIIKLHNDHSLDKLPNSEHCKIPNCPMKELHNTESHHCQFCGNRHSERKCDDINSIPYFTFDCPLCRKSNTICCSQTRIVGSSEKCSICLENNVEIYMPECGHICLCYSCMETLDDTNSRIESLDTMRQHTFDNFNQLLDNTINLLNGKEMVYTIIYLDLGCQIFIRKQKRDDEIQGFFMHSDNWGQYGQHLSDVSMLNSFKYGYRHIVNN